ncbi:MAG TPA: hypothetical protein VGD98_00185 [Ktedonobacteraceae bacterium]
MQQEIPVSIFSILCWRVLGWTPYQRLWFPARGRPESLAPAATLVALFVGRAAAEWSLAVIYSDLVLPGCTPVVEAAVFSEQVARMPMARAAAELLPGQHWR